jgi:hypothetical protein
MRPDKSQQAKPRLPTILYSVLKEPTLLVVPGHKTTDWTTHVPIQLAQHRHLRLVLAASSAHVLWPGWDLVRCRCRMQGQTRVRRYGDLR